MQTRLQHMFSYLQTCSNTQQASHSNLSPLVQQ